MTLAGRCVVVTRPRAQAPRLVELLEAYGAEVVPVPTIRIDPPEDWGPLDGAIGVLDRFRWLVFTSVNGVAAFRDRLARAGRDASALASAQVAAIGPATAGALRRMGVTAHVMPSEYRAEALAEALRGGLAPGTEVLLVRAAEAREVLPRQLRALGARVTVVAAYRTATLTEGAERLGALLEAGRIDAVTFTSSSTVRGFMGLVPPGDRRRLLEPVVLAAIGPITAETLAGYGHAARVMPEEYTVPALAAALARHFEDAPPVRVPGRPGR